MPIISALPVCSLTWVHFLQLEELWQKLIKHHNKIWSSDVLIICMCKKALCLIPKYQIPVSLDPEEKISYFYL